MFIFSPLGLENGRGGEISVIELASGLQKFYKIMLMDTNIFIEHQRKQKKEHSKLAKLVKQYNLVTTSPRLAMPEPEPRHDEISAFYRDFRTQGGTI